MSCSIKSSIHKFILSFTITDEDFFYFNNIESESFLLINATRNHSKR